MIDSSFQKQFTFQKYRNSRGTINFAGTELLASLLTLMGRMMWYEMVRESE